MARCDPVGIRLITRRGNDWTQRYPLVVEAVNHLNVRSCLIDGEVVCCDERGATFQLLRHRRNEPQAFLYAFDVLACGEAGGRGGVAVKRPMMIDAIAKRKAAAKVKAINFSIRLPPGPEATLSA